MIDPHEFARLLHSGHGRAILHLQKHDATPHREAILYACVHNTVFDRQINGSNAAYIYEAIGLAVEAAFYRDALLAGLQETEDAYHLDQICDLLRYFAQDGDRAAREALYAAFDNDAEHYASMFAIVELDGLPGFLHVANGVGESAAADEEFWEGDYFLGQLDDRYGADVAREAVAAAAASNPRIAAYIEAIEKGLRRSKATEQPRFDPKTMGYEELKEIVAGKGHWSSISLRRWGTLASDDDLARLADDVLAEADPKRLAAYLGVFAERQFPLGHTPLIHFVDHPEHRVSHAASAALSNFRHQEVRALALKLLTSERAWMAIELLRNNFQDGDYLLIEAALAQPTERVESDQHWFEMEVRELFQNNPSPAATTALLTLFEQGRCLLCRYSTVKLLHRLGTLPEAIRRECEFDADFGLRAAARRHFRDDGAVR